MEGNCKRCGSFRHLVKSHVIPKAFFDLSFQAEEGPLKLFSNVEGFYPKKAPIGVYDTILCSECEEFFSDVDSYAADLLLNGRGRFTVVRGIYENVAIKLDQYNYSLLKRFFMAVLWRAGVSGQSFFHKVSLGPYEDRLLKMLDAKDPGEADEFAVALASFDDHPVSSAIPDPFCRRKPVRHYQFQLNRYVAYMKVDNRPFEPSCRDVQLRAGSPLVVILRSFGKSKEHQVARSIAQKNASYRHGK